MGVQSSAVKNESAAVHTPLVPETEAMAEPLGSGLYRGLLKTVVRAWSPIQINDAALRKNLLEYIQAAERGLRRLNAELGKIGPECLVPILRSLHFNSLTQVDSLKTLHQYPNLMADY